MYLYWASTLPRLAFGATTAEPESGLFKVRATVENQGLLPTHVTAKAVENGYADPVVVTLAAGPGEEVVMGAPRVVVGHLSGAGFDYRQALSSGQAAESAPSRDVSWMVRGPAGGWVEIVATAAKAGVARARLTLR